MRELLADHANILIQMDHHRVHYVKCIMDEVFGEDNFINEIIWHKGREGGSSRSHSKSAAIPTEYQNILLYAKNKESRFWNPPLGPYKQSTLQAIEKDEKGWFYTRGRMGRTPAQWELEKGSGLKTYVCDNPRLSREEVVKLLTSPDAKYVEIGDIWNSELVRLTRESNYPTEKPESLLDIIIQAGSDPGHLVLDCFVGSGTTCAVAQKLGRRWIGVDINTGAIQTTSKRLQKIILGQYEKKVEDRKQKKLDKTKEHPDFLSFLNYKVNDYDLQILKTEATELAIQHIGVERTRSDQFFDGVLATNLVKIIDLNHPLTLVDLQLVQDELKKRPEENRNVTIVCLGKELAVDPWVDDYNTKHPVNKIEIIELRTDKKYGKFLIHRPPEAQVEIHRSGRKATIEIKNFISPSIVERLNDPESLVKVKISDFRSMIDVVLIDNNYNGKTFGIKHSDVPEKQSDLVVGKYEIEMPEKKAVVAVKVVDMLGEEVLITKEI
jgi:DNA modification methylase